MSKGLKALKEIVDYAIGTFTDHERKYQKDLEIVEKELKALEIIKENFTITEQRQVQHKNLWNLTQEEYDLLTEVLK